MLDNKKDKAATKAAKFLCVRSWISNAGHQYLCGADKQALITRVYNDARGLCCACGLYRPIWKFDLDHVGSGTRFQRCDCYRRVLDDGSLHTNVRIICTMDPNKGVQSNCHQLRHNREPRLRRIA